MIFLSDYTYVRLPDGSVQRLGHTNGLLPGQTDSAVVSISKDSVLASTTEVDAKAYEEHQRKLWDEYHKLIRPIEERAEKAQAQLEAQAAEAAK